MPFVAPLLVMAGVAADTAATTAAVAGGVGAVASAAGAVMSGVDSAASDKMQAQGMRAEAGVLTYNQGIAKQEAQEAQTKGDMDANQLRLAQSRQKGKAAAAIGASGVTDTGSALDVMNSNARLMENDLMTQQYNTAVTVGQYTSQADLLSYESAQERAGAGFTASEAGPAMASGFLNAGANILGGAYKYSGRAYAAPSFGPEGF